MASCATPRNNDLTMGSALGWTHLNSLQASLDQREGLPPIQLEVPWMCISNTFKRIRSWPGEHRASHPRCFTKSSVSLETPENFLYQGIIQPRALVSSRELVRRRFFRANALVLFFGGANLHENSKRGNLLCRAET